MLGRKITDEGDIFAAEDDLLAQAKAGEAASAELELLLRGARLAGARSTACSSTAREFGHEGEVHVGSEEEMDFLGIPGLLEPDQVRELLHQRQSERARKQKRSRRGRRRRTSSRSCPPTSSSRCCAASSTAWSRPGTTAPARRTAITHAALRKECGGPAAAVATADQLHERIDRLREWAARKTS